MKLEFIKHVGRTGDKVVRNQPIPESKPEPEKVKEKPVASVFDSFVKPKEEKEAVESTETDS